MRKALRAGAAILLAYLLQSTVLTYLKVRGAQIELMTVTLFFLGSVLGMYGGVCSGLAAAFIMEALGGNIPVFSTVFCVGAGVAGAVIVRRTDALSLPGNRGREQLIRRFAPKAAVLALVLLKEGLYLIYFFLNGVSLGYIHFFRAFFTAAEAGLLAFILQPLIRWWMLHKPKTRAERKAERLAYEAEEAKEKKKKKRKKKQDSFMSELMARPEAEKEEAPEDALREETGIPEGWRLAREDEPETADEPAQDDENRAAEPPETNDPVNHAETAQREEGRKGGEEGKG